MGRIIKDFISLFFPRTCINCKRVLISSEMHICLHCRLGLPITNFHKQKQNPLKQRLGSINNLNQAFAYLIYNKGGIAQKMLHKLKYDGNEEMGYKLGLWMGYEIQECVEDIALIIPVPLHIKKRKTRGYNQCDSISKGLSEALEIPWDKDIVLRTKFNPTQTKKGKINRWLNVEQLFEINKVESIRGKNIMIVDDVITTGATIESLSNLIIKSGAKSISVACIASGQ